MIINNSNAARERRLCAEKVAKRKSDLKKYFDHQEEYRRMVKRWQGIIFK